jgi:hypothetical protein
VGLAIVLCGLPRFIPVHQEGNVDIDGWVRKFVKMHTGMPVSFENLPQPQPRIIPIFTPDALQYFPKMPATDLARYLMLAERGKPLPPGIPVAPANRGEQQRDDLELCVRYTRKLLASS